MSCMSPYSIPLCTIFTKCPAPSDPTQSQQGSPSLLAAIDWKMSAKETEKVELNIATIQKHSRADRTVNMKKSNSARKNPTDSCKSVTYFKEIYRKLTLPIFELQETN